MKKLTTIATLGIIAFSIAGLKAADSQIFQASLTPDIAIHSRTTEIDGLSLNVWGENPQKGFTLGFVNGSTGNSAGFTVGLVNYSESYNGVSWGLININTVNFVGWQDGLINVAQGEFSGFQSAWIMNYSKNIIGFQLGFVNYAENLHGVQIGLANIAMNNPWFNDFPDKLATGFPIVNWSF